MRVITMCKPNRSIARVIGVYGLSSHNVVEPSYIDYIQNFGLPHPR